MGRIDVDAMLEEMTPEQFDEWIAYSQLEPFDNGWMQTGILACTIHNMILVALHAYAGKKVSARELATPEDFIPTIERRKKPKRIDTQTYEKAIEMQARRWQR